MYPTKNKSRIQEGLIGVSGKADDLLQPLKWGKLTDIGREGKGGVNPKTCANA